MYKKIENFLNDLLKFNLPKEQIDKVTYKLIYLFFLVLLIPMSFLEMYESIEFFKLYVNIDIIFIIVFGYIFIYNIKNKRVKYSWDFILLTIFLIIGFMSCFKAVNFFIAFEGSSIRREGFLTILIYYLLYINSKSIVSKNNIKNLINLFFFIGIIQFIYGFCQSYFEGGILFKKNFVHMAYGLCGNPNFFGTYMMMLSLLGLLISLFYKEATNYHKICTLIFFIGLVLSQSSGPFLTYCLMLIIIIIYNKVKKQNKANQIVIWLAIFVSLYTVFNYSTIYINKHIYKSNITDNSTLSGDIKILTQGIVNKTSNILIGRDLIDVTKVDETTVGSGRFGVWKETINYIGRDNNIWLGSGLDSLSIYVDNGSTQNTITNKIELNFSNIDKAHNCYLNILATTGIFSLIAYLGWTFILHKETYSSNNILVQILLLVFIGYNIQSLLNISVIEVSPYYYTLTGLMMGLIHKKS